MGTDAYAVRPRTQTRAYAEMHICGSFSMTWGVRCLTTCTKLLCCNIVYVMLWPPRNLPVKLTVSRASVTSSDHMCKYVHRYVSDIQLIIRLHCL
jgi:hypothetical protein